MKPHPVTTQLRIERHGIEDILVNVTGSYHPPTRATREDEGDPAELEDVKAAITYTITYTIAADDGQPLYIAGDRIDLTEDEIEQAERKITQERT